MKTPWINFEGLGIKFEGIERAFNVFGFPIYWYGILIAFGFLLATILGMRACKKFGFTQDDILTYLVICTPASIVCARLYYVVFEWNQYSSDLLKIFSLREGGLAIYGAVIGIILAAIITARVKKQNVIKLFDFALPYLLIGQAIGRWGNFINQEAYGVETSLPWRMYGSGIENGFVAVHPNFLYESLWCLLIFALIMVYRKYLFKNVGEIMCLYFVGYGIGRAIIESIRGEDTLLFAGYRVSMWLSIILVLIFGGLFTYLRFFKSKQADVVSDDESIDEMETTETIVAEDEEISEDSVENNIESDSIMESDSIGESSSEEN